LARGGGVGLDLGPVQTDQTQADHADRRTEPQRGDQQPGQGLLMPDPEAGEGDVIGRSVGAQDPEGDVLVAAPLQLREERTPVQ
jgi:hypothetical protein